jgi:hypothetical protein
MRVIRVFGVAGVLLLAACGGQDPNSRQDAYRVAAASAAAAGECQPGVPDPRACDASETQKTTICHIPPGNPENAHTLCVGTPAVDAHLAHGDHLGSCCDADAPPPSDPPPSDPPPPSSPPPSSPPPSSPPPSDPAPIS